MSVNPMELAKRLATKVNKDTPPGVSIYEASEIVRLFKLSGWDTMPDCGGATDSRPDMIPIYGHTVWWFGWSDADEFVWLIQSQKGNEDCLGQMAQDFKELGFASADEFLLHGI